MDHGEGETLVSYEVGGLDMTARWTLDRRRWFLIDIDLPIPPFEQALERFLLAWNASQIEVIASLTLQR